MQEPKPEYQVAEELVATCITKLREHFEDVQIFCTRVDRPSGETKRCFRGDGNLYARHGMCHEFLQRAKALDFHDAVEDLKNE